MVGVFLEFCRSRLHRMNGSESQAQFSQTLGPEIASLAASDAQLMAGRETI